MSEAKGVPLQDLWNDIAPVRGDDSTGSPDQKPLALYERIIKAGSNENDLVLDPFCGCATTIIAANNLKRRWVGVDRRKDARYHIITQLMGLTRKQRAELEKKAQYDNQEWLDKQTARYEMHYQTEPPIRTDNSEQSIPELEQVYLTEPESLLSHKEMKDRLIEQFGVVCWGCGFEPPDNDSRYLQLDHINPKSSGGTNDIDNRALLCQPCNLLKLNKMTLDALRKENKKENLLKKDESELIDLISALTWTRNHMLEIREQNPRQYTLFRNKT